MPRFRHGFFDRTQPEYLFNQFFSLEVEMPIVKETINQFLIKAPLLMIFLALTKFFIIEIVPPFLGMILLAILYYLVVFLLVQYFLLINRLVKSRGFVGIGVCILILIMLILVI